MKALILPFVLAGPGNSSPISRHKFVSRYGLNWRSYFVDLPALTYRDAQANTLLDFLDLNPSPAFLTPPTLAAPAMATLGLGACQGTPPDPVITPTP